MSATDCRQGIENNPIVHLQQRCPLAVQKPSNWSDSVYGDSV